MIEILNKMKSLDVSFFCITVLLCVLTFFGSKVKAQCEKTKLEIKTLCQTDASYGTVLGNYTTTGLISCTASCKSSCKSFTYDEATGRCITNSLALADIPVCDVNVKYGHKEQKKQCLPTELETKDLCHTNASYGFVLSNYTTSELSQCEAHCESSCKSFTYDEATGQCITNWLALADVQACDVNVKYGHKEQCVLSGQFKICSPDLCAVPYEIRGYILVNLTGEWGTICERDWYYYGSSNADVVCKSFGYGSGEYDNDYYYEYGFGDLDDGYYVGLVAMDSIQCTGTEADLLECPYYSSSTCHHRRDVVVICKE